MMRIMGMDVGDRRIGLAVSDEMGYSAQGLDTFTRANLKQDVRSLAEMMKELQVEKLVIGMPRNMNGTYGPQTEKVKEFVAALLKEISIEVIYWDERLTSVAAQRTLAEGKIALGKKKEAIDKLSAVMILQGYLDSMSIR